MTNADACPDLGTLSQLVDGELEGSMARTTVAHVGRCPRCGGRMAALERAASAGRVAAPHTAAAAAATPRDGCIAPGQLVGYVTQVLTADDMRRAESHLEQCDACLVAAQEALRTTHALASAALEVPATLRARVSSRWTEDTSSVVRLAIEIARAGLRLVEQHLAPPVLALESRMIPLPAYRAGEERGGLSVTLRAEDTEIRATIVPEDGGVGVTLLLVDREGAPLVGQRLYLRHEGRSIFSARTDGTGELRLPRLEPGVYEVAYPGVDAKFSLDLRI